MADYSAYGPWVGGDDWRAWVGVYITTNNETTLAGRIESWVWSEYGTTSGYSNIRGAAAWDGNSWSYGSNASISTNSWKKLKEVTFSVAKGHSATSDYAWARAEGVSGIYSGSSSEVKVKVSIPAKKSYAVSYNSNGHGTAPSGQTKWHGETLQLRGAISASGYTFRGWNTKADGSGTTYSAGANYTANAAVTLYAQWAASTYTITPNANGGTLKSGCTALTKTYGVNLTLWAASLNPTRTGYTFLGWSTSSTATSATYAAGATYSANAAATLYAVWQVETYTVSYNGNAPVGTATNVPSAQSKTYNVTLVLSSVEPMLSGYSFLGWGTSSSATTPSYQPGGNYTNNAAATLYAVWGNSYEPPAIFDLAVVRSDGTQDSDDGTRCHVSLGWSVDSTDGGQIGSVTVGYKVRNSSGDYTTETASVTGTTTGTADVILSGTFALNQAYDIKVTVTDNHGTSAIKTSVLSISYFTLDFLAGGTGIAMGKAATRDGLDVAMPSYFSEVLDATGGAKAAWLSVNGGTAAITSGGNATVSGLDVLGAIKFGGTKQYKEVLDSTGKSLASGTWTPLGSVTLGAGVWVVVFSAQFGSNATGRRSINLSTNSGSTSLNVQAALQLQAANGGYTVVSRANILDVSTTTTYYLNGYQNSGSTLTTTSDIRAARIA